MAILFLFVWVLIGACLSLFIPVDFCILLGFIFTCCIFWVGNVAIEKIKADRKL